MTTLLKDGRAFLLRVAVDNVIGPTLLHQ